MFISQTGLTYFYKWPITCKIQILNLIASVEVGFAIDVTRGFPFSPLVSFTLQRASGTRVLWHMRSDNISRGLALQLLYKPPNTFRGS